MRLMRLPLVIAVLCLVLTHIAVAMDPMPVPTLSDPFVDRKLPAFVTELVDVSTEPPTMSGFDSAKASKITAYIVVTLTCPVTRDYTQRFSQTVAELSKKGIDFIYVYPSREDARPDKFAFHKANALGGRLVDDQKGVLTKQLHLTRATEILLVDRAGKIVYHGNLDDSRNPDTVSQHFFADAVEATLAGQPVKRTFSQVFACPIHFEGDSIR